MEAVHVPHDFQQSVWTANELELPLTPRRTLSTMRFGSPISLAASEPHRNDGYRRIQKEAPSSKLQVAAAPELRQGLFSNRFDEALHTLLDSRTAAGAATAGAAGLTAQQQAALQQAVGQVWC